MKRKRKRGQGEGEEEGEGGDGWCQRGREGCGRRSEMWVHFKGWDFNENKRLIVKKAR